MPARTSRAFGPLGTARYAVNGVGFDMVRLPPGRFIDGEGTDRREFLVSRPFEIGATLVTQALWQAVMGSSPSRFFALDRPVERVSWNDAQDFLSRLEHLGVRGFRLPTEAEWVWASRCGASTRWAGADRSLPVAVSRGHSTALVGVLLPSAAGVFDLSGNVWELQSNRWVRRAAAGVDVQGPASGPASSRVSRGGSWIYDPLNARIADRDGITPGHGDSNLGFRLFRTVP